MKLQMLSTLLLSIALNWGCVEKETDVTSEPELVVLDTLHIFTDFETHSIASPSSIHVLNNGLIAISDYSTQTISLVDSTGVLKHKFGRKGRGPGDFLNILEIYDHKEKVIVLDSHLNRLSYFNYDGAFLSSTSLPSETTNKEFHLINDTSYIWSIK